MSGDNDYTPEEWVGVTILTPEVHVALTILTQEEHMGLTILTTEERVGLIIFTLEERVGFKKSPNGGLSVSIVFAVGKTNMSNIS